MCSWTGSLQILLQRERIITYYWASENSVFSSWPALIWSCWVWMQLFATQTAKFFPMSTVFTALLVWVDSPGAHFLQYYDSSVSPQHRENHVNPQKKQKPTTVLNGSTTHWNRLGSQNEKLCTVVCTGRGETEMWGVPLSICDRLNQKITTLLFSH